MHYYHEQILSELSVWQKKMLRQPSIVNWLSQKVQVKINTWIPEKIHRAITTTIKQMLRGVLFGATHTTAKPLSGASLQACEAAVLKRIAFYRTTAAVEGGITGAGGILLSLADFPILIGLKMKLLFDISAMYGFNVADYKERVYLLRIFELAFSSHEHRRKIYLEMVDWDQKSKKLPEDIHQFDWRDFQQEYRNYIDLAKMAQIIPIIGAPVGFVVNSRLINKLGLTAMNAYRMRLLKNDAKTAVIASNASLSTTCVTPAPTCGKSQHGVTCTQPSPANTKSLSPIVEPSNRGRKINFPTYNPSASSTTPAAVD